MTTNSIPFIPAETTHWEIRPSLKFDALCFMNIMTADEFYLRFYQSEYDKYKDMLREPVREALAGLKKKVKVEENKIISAWLCLYFSGTTDESLDDMIQTLNESDMLKENFKQSPYYSDEDWMLFESVFEELKIILYWLIEIEFESHWKKNACAKVSDRINEFSKNVSEFNVIGKVEEHLGFKLASSRITVFMLYYSRPHGIKITGTRFLTDAAWPFSILVSTASHEMMHPPFDLKNDTALVSSLNKLRSDQFLMNKVLNHNPSFGYNTFKGFVEEDCVQALDQIINEKLGITRDPAKRWQDSDDGMHVLAIALYNIMKQERYNDGKMIFRDFLINKIETGDLLNGKIEKIYNNFYSLKNI